jgi:prepilin-type N-terminal cleavage/methylation domain-containing protein
MTPGPAWGKGGMTLLELVVGLTIAGLAVTAGYAALATLADRSRAADRTLGRVSAAAAKRRMLTSWLDGASLTLDEAGPTFRGLDGTWGDVPDDQLTFYTTAETPIGRGGVIVRLYIDRDTLTAERGLTAEFARWPNPPTRRIEIEPRAAGLDCRYFTRTLARPEWLPSWISSTVLPIAAELRLLAAPGDTLAALLATPLLVPLGNGA